MGYETTLKTPFEIGGVLALGVLPQDSKTPYKVSLSNEKPLEIGMLPTFIYYYARKPKGEMRLLPSIVELKSGQFIPYKRADSDKTIFPRVSQQAQEVISKTAEEIWLNAEYSNIWATSIKDAQYLRNWEQKRISRIKETIQIKLYTDPIVKIGNEKPIGPEENVNIYGFSGTVALLGLRNELMKIAELAPLISKKIEKRKKKKLHLKQ
jgi:hypothetical protein